MEQGFVARCPDGQLGEDQLIVVIENGIIKSESMSTDRFVGTPGMNSICKHLADGLNVQTQTRIAQVVPAESGGVELYQETGDSLGNYDRLIVSAPAAQTAELLSSFPDLPNRISRIEMKPCWATMVAFEKPITSRWVGAFLHNSFLSWAARNNTKPGRNRNTEQLVIHAGPEWTAENWDQDGDDIVQRMLKEFWNVTGILPQPHIHLESHRWRYAIPVDPSNKGFVADESAVVIGCGDWVSGSRVEGAFLSGMSAAGRILGTLTPARHSHQPQQAFLFE